MSRFADLKAMLLGVILLAGFTDIYGINGLVFYYYTCRNRIQIPVYRFTVLGSWIIPVSIDEANIVEKLDKW